MVLFAATPAAGDGLELLVHKLDALLLGEREELLGSLAGAGLLLLLRCQVLEILSRLLWLMSLTDAIVVRANSLFRPMCTRW